MVAVMISVVFVGSAYAGGYTIPVEPKPDPDVLKFKPFPKPIPPRDPWTPPRNPRFPICPGKPGKPIKPGKPCYPINPPDLMPMPEIR